MKWRIANKPKRDLTKWHLSFAWTPKQIGDYKYWLCRVWRRTETTEGDNLEGWIIWEYATMACIDV